MDRNSTETPKKITIDQISLENVEIEFGDIQADLGINGFIGTDILTHFDININSVHIPFSPKQIIFFQTGLQDKQDFLFPVNQSRGTRGLNPVILSEIFIISRK